MSSDKFKQRNELTVRILCDENQENLLTVADNRNLIDRNLLEEFPKVSLDRQGVKLKETKLESTEQIDIRVKKLDELDESLKNFTKNIKKQIKYTDKHCDRHQNAKPAESSIFINEFIENDLPLPVIDSVIRIDEIVVQQHLSNISKMTKLMETVKGHNYVEATLPAVGVVNDSTTVLSEVFDDVDYLNESGTMYNNGLSEEAPTCPYTKEIKDITDNLYMQ